MADNDEWSDAARDAARDDGGWNDKRSASPRRGATPPRRDRSRSRSPPRNGAPDRGRPGDPGEVNPGNNLYVSGVSHRVQDADLEEAFAKYGKLIKAQVMYDPHSREPRGFAFVTFERPEDAEAAIEGMTGVEMMGRTITVAKARRGRARTPTPGRYFGPPKREPPPPRGVGYGPPTYDRYGPPPPRDPYDRYGPPRSPPPRDPYDRYGRPPPPPPRDYPPPPRDYPPRGYGRYSPPPPPRSRYAEDLPPPRSRYDDLPPPPPRSRYDDVPPPPRRY